jgi:1-acyl-sn-glycerol-3-phosphate acyltransferase
VANHESFIDGLLIGLMMPVDAVFVVHSQIASRPFFAFCSASCRTWPSIRPVRWR